MSLTFTPCGVGGAQTGTLTITSNDPVNPTYAVALSGYGRTEPEPLVTGWNLIGLPVQPTNTALTTVLSAILPNVSVVWAYINGEWALLRSERCRRKRLEDAHDRERLLGST